MKRIISVLLSIGLLALIVSCSNVSNATVGTKITDKKMATINVTSEDDVVVFGDSRTIVPDALNGNDFTFYLWGTDKLDSSNSITAPIEVTFTSAAGSSTTGTVNLNVSVSQWELKLAMVPSVISSPTESTVISAAYLYGTATVDLRYNDSISFCLTPNRLTATGGVSLSIISDGWTLPSGYTVTAGIYVQDTDAAISASGSTASLAAFGTTPSTFAVTGITPETYNFKVTFTNTTTSKAYTWSDKIIVLPNQTTTQTVVIPDVIGKVPNAPTAFYAGYVDAAASDENNFYVQFVWKDNSNNEDYFKLDLFDVTGYESIADSSAKDACDAAIATIVDTSKTIAEKDTAWETTLLTTNVSYAAAPYGVVSYGKETNATLNTTQFFENDDIWVDGSLNKNNTFAVFALPLGHKYVARLTATNVAGSSANVYANIFDGTDSNFKAYTNRTVSVAATGVTAWEADSTAINRYRIKYDLNTGAFYTNDGSSGATIKWKDAAVAANNVTASVTGVVANKKLVVRYANQFATEANNVVIMNPLHELLSTAAATPVDTDYAILVKSGSYRWTDWLENSTSGASYFKAPAAPYDAIDATEVYNTGCKNLNLYANYNIGYANLVNMADLNMTMADVIVYGSATSIDASGISGATKIDLGTYYKSFALNTNGNTTPKGYKYLYFCVRNTDNKKYSKVTVNVPGQGEPEAPYAQTTLTADKYTVQTSEPADWATSYTDAYTLKGQIFTAVTGASAPTWKTGTYYTKASVSDTFSYVEVNAQALQAVKHTVTVNAYVPGYPKPFTYPITIDIADGLVPTYTELATQPTDDTGIATAISDAGANGCWVSTDKATFVQVQSGDAFVTGGTYYKCDYGVTGPLY